MEYFNLIKKSLKHTLWLIGNTFKIIYLFLSLCCAAKILLECAEKRYIKSKIEFGKNA